MEKNRTHTREEAEHALRKAGDSVFRVVQNRGQRHKNTRKTASAGCTHRDRAIETARLAGQWTNGRYGIERVQAQKTENAEQERKHRRQEIVRRRTWAKRKIQGKINEGPRGKARQQAQ